MRLGTPDNVMAPVAPVVVQFATGPPVGATVALVVVAAGSKGIGTVTVVGVAATTTVCPVRVADPVPANMTTSPVWKVFGAPRVVLPPPALAMVVTAIGVPAAASGGGVPPPPPPPTAVTTASDPPPQALSPIPATAATKINLQSFLDPMVSIRDISV
jgi:hypothetical protein